MSETITGYDTVHSGHRLGGYPGDSRFEHGSSWSGTISRPSPVTSAECELRLGKTSTRITDVLDGGQIADCRVSVNNATSGGQFNRYGTYTVPTPRLTKIVVFSRRAVPATIGNLRAAKAPTTGSTT